VTETSVVAHNKIKSSRNVVVGCFLSIFFSGSSTAQRVDAVVTKRVCSVAIKRTNY